MTASSADAFDEAAEFAIDHRFYLAAFNHLTPFPGTPLFARLQREGRLLYERWWLDERYGYNGIPFQPADHGGGRHPHGMPAGAPQVLFLGEHGAPRHGPRESRRRLHVSQFLRHQRHAPRGSRQTRPLSRWEIRLGTDLCSRRRERPIPGRGRSRLRGRARRRTMPISAACCARTRLGGWVRLSLEREPAAFDADFGLSRSHAFIIARDRATGEAIGICERSVRDAFVDGEIRPLALSRIAARCARPPPPDQGAARRVRGHSIAAWRALRSSLRADLDHRRQRNGAARAVRGLAGTAGLSAGWRAFDLRAPHDGRTHAARCRAGHA